MSILTFIALIALVIVALLVLLKTRTNPISYFMPMKKKVMTEKTVTTTQTIDDIELPRAVDEVHIVKEEITETETYKSNTL
jgi:hypothetical protein